MGTPKHMFGYEIQDLMGRRILVVSGKDYPAALERAYTKIALQNKSGHVLVPLVNRLEPTTDSWSFEYDYDSEKTIEPKLESIEPLFKLTNQNFMKS
jgi:hypothetical protein